MVLIAGPLVWLFSTLAAHFAAGLSWPTATVIGAVLVVTGPTVIMPLLRSAQLKRRPSSLLRWEAIVNDPIGALFAVFAFETYLVLHGTHDAWTLSGLAILAFVVATVGAYFFAQGLAYVFIRGWVAEYLKAPVLFTSVLIAYAISDMILEESGLLTVTVMGIHARQHPHLVADGDAPFQGNGDGPPGFRPVHHADREPALVGLRNPGLERRPVHRARPVRVPPRRGDAGDDRRGT